MVKLLFKAVGGVNFVVVAITNQNLNRTSAIASGMTVKLKRKFGAQNNWQNVSEGRHLG